MTTIDWNYNKSVLNRYFPAVKFMINTLNHYLETGEVINTGVTVSISCTGSELVELNEILVQLRLYITAHRAMYYTVQEYPDGQGTAETSEAHSIVDWLTRNRLCTITISNHMNRAINILRGN